MRYTTTTPATGGDRGDRAQYPDTMAYMAVEAMVKKLNGEAAPEKNDSPIKLITKDNVAGASKYYKDE
jgi:ABC-type sugar transport system substrate-binding protein